jgi:hypothetical protein
MGSKGGKTVGIETRLDVFTALGKLDTFLGNVKIVAEGEANFIFPSLDQEFFIDLHGRTATRHACLVGLRREKSNVTNKRL